MGDLVIMLIVGQILPITLLGLGLMIWKTRPPFNGIMGYRTSYSQKNERLWNMGQELFGKYCAITYAVFLALSLISGLIPIIFKMDKYTASVIFSAMHFIQMISLFAIIGITDGKLKKSLKEDGGKDDRSDD